MSTQTNRCNVDRVKHRSIFARARLAWQLLRDYEREEAEPPASAAEAIARITEYAAVLPPSNGEGAERWRQAAAARVESLRVSISPPSPTSR